MSALCVSVGVVLHLADQITDMKLKHPDSLLIVLGANLGHELPKYKQHIKCPTRNKLDNCYNLLRVVLGLCDHFLVYFLST